MRSFRILPAVLTATAFSLFLFSAERAQAMLEVRGGYQLEAANPTDINNWSGSTGPQLGTQAGITADAIVKLPLVPFGFGFRYDDYSQSVGTAANGYSVKSDFTRYSLVLNHRFIDHVVYVGPIGTFGVSNGLNYQKTTGSTTTTYTTAGGQFSATGGIEAGVKLGFLRFGAEVGYLYAPLGNLQNAGANVSNNGANVAPNFSGVYGRATVGIGF